MSNQQRSLLPAPRVTTLPDIPGGQPGLLPAEATSKDLKVGFDQLVDSDPTQGQETVRLIWDDTVGARKDWDAPMAPDDRFVMLPVTLLYHGVHRLYYHVTKWDGNTQESETITLAIDTRAPELAGNNNPPIPPADLIDKRVTARYLEEHADQLVIEVPAWDVSAGGPQPGDVLTWYWEDDPAGQQVAGSKTLSLADMERSVTVDGDLIRARGDGERYVMFQVSDRAGNKSAHSRALHLTVKTARPPRQLPRPRLKGTSNTFLDPLDGLAGVVLEIPPEAVLDEDDEVFMQWGSPGEPGAWRGRVDIDTRQCRVPAPYVAANLGRSEDQPLPVYYEALDYDSQIHESEQLPLRIQPLRGVPALQCEGVIGDVVSIGEVKAYEDQGIETPLWIGEWPFMAQGQQIRVMARNNSQDQVLVAPQAVSPGKPQRIGKLLQADLQRLSLGALILRAEVSFDGQRWLAFRPATATLQS